VKLADSFVSIARLALVPRRLRSAPPALQRAHVDAVVVSSAVLGGPLIAAVAMVDGPLDHAGTDSVLLAVGVVFSTVMVARRTSLHRRLVDAGRSGHPLSGECLHPLPVDHGGPESVSAAGSGCPDGLRCVECVAVHDRSAMASWTRRLRDLHREGQRPRGRETGIAAAGSAHGARPGGLRRFGLTPGACGAVVVAVVALLVWIGGQPLLGAGAMTPAAGQVLLVVRVLAMAGVVIAVDRAFLWHASVGPDDPSVPPGVIALDAPGSGTTGPDATVARHFEPLRERTRRARARLRTTAPILRRAHRLHATIAVILFGVPALWIIVWMARSHRGSDPAFPLLIGGAIVSTIVGFRCEALGRRSSALRCVRPAAFPNPRRSRLRSRHDERRHHGPAMRRLRGGARSRSDRGVDSLATGACGRLAARRDRRLAGSPATARRDAPGRRRDRAGGPLAAGLERGPRPLRAGRLDARGVGRCDRRAPVRHRHGRAGAHASPAMASVARPR